jgi:hypothetical protein
MPSAAPVTLSRRAAIRRTLLAIAGAVVGSGSTRGGKIDKLAFKISAGMAPDALAEFVRQSGFQVLFDFDAIRNVSTHEVTGQLEPAEALSRMFEGSGLTFEFINDRTIAVRPRPPETLPVTQPG